MATLTVYPDSGNPGTTSVDSDIQNHGTVFSTVRSASTGIIVGEGGTDDIYFGSDLSAGNYYIRRAVLNFDTSALTSDATITAATLSLQARGGSCSSADSDSLRFTTNTISSNNSVATTDFASFNTAAIASDIAVNSINDTDTMVDYSLTDLSVISKTGVTHLALRSLNEINNSAPTDRNYSSFRCRESNAGLSGSPKLTITYSLPVQNLGRMFLFF